MFRWILSGVGRTTVSIDKEKSRSFFMRSRWLTLCKEAMIIAVFKVRAEMVEVKNVEVRNGTMGNKYRGSHVLVDKEEGVATPRWAWSDSL